MKRLKYVLSRLKDMNYKKMFSIINLVHKKTKKSRIAIFFELLKCTSKYEAGYTDYYSFGMYDMTEEERKTILTRGKNNYYVALYNPKEHWHIFDNKNEFNTIFNDYLKRNWFFLENKTKEEFKAWVKDLSEFIAKPNNDSGGHGIEKIVVSNFEDSDALYDYLYNKRILLLEELVVQHDELKEVNPSSVNTIRIITILKHDKLHYITAFLRIGNNNNFVDNTSSGGMLTMVDISSGMTLFPACDGNMNIYERHPITNKEIKGIQIPYFEETKELIEELARVVKGINYVAWDIAITKDGPVVIEGNPYPGYYYQFPVHTPNKIGVLPVFEKIERGD